MSFCLLQKICPSHTAGWLPYHHSMDVVHRLLTKILPNNVRGSRCSVAWPVRFLNLTFLDLFLWGHMKSIMSKRWRNTDETKDMITSVCASIKHALLKSIQFACLSKFTKYTQS